MLAEGISVRVVQEIGGWTSLRMLERYTHQTDAEKLRAVEAACLVAIVCAPLKPSSEPTHVPSSSVWPTLLQSRSKSLPVAFERTRRDQNVFQTACHRV